jgi:hypothetical protein
MFDLFIDDQVWETIQKLKAIQDLKLSKSTFETRIIHFYFQPLRCPFYTIFFCLNYEWLAQEPTRI